MTKPYKFSDEFIVVPDNSFGVTVYHVGSRLAAQCNKHSSQFKNKHEAIKTIQKELEVTPAKVMWVDFEHPFETNTFVYKELHEKRWDIVRNKVHVWAEKDLKSKRIRLRVVRAGLSSLGTQVRALGTKYIPLAEETEFLNLTLEQYLSKLSSLFNVEFKGY